MAENLISQDKIDKQVYLLAKEYLLSLEKITSELLEKYLVPPEGGPKTLSEIYIRMLESAQNAGMGPKVIGEAMGGLEKLRPLLLEFEPRSVVAKYGNDWARVLDDIVVTIKPKGKVRKTPRSLWPRFCKTIVSGAKFLAQFETADDFGKWVDFFDRDERARPSLPMLLQYEIDGFGFPLACDFLKEIGYANFGKPDVHLKAIFAELKLSETRKDYDVFKAIVRVAKNAGVTPYNVDKLFWLIGSGKFYFDHLFVGRHKKEFIRYAKSKSARQ
jgi:thermostable 8-oxoguanine DNA glycosylase